MDTYGNYRLIRPRSHGYFSLSDPTDVLVLWEGGEREVINGVTRAYITEDGRLTLMAGRKALAKVSLINTHKRYRAGRMESFYISGGGVQTYSILQEVRAMFKR